MSARFVQAMPASLMACGVAISVAVACTGKLEVAFGGTTVSTAPSNPTNSIFFQAGIPGCEKCATFHGDYVGVAYGSDGKANMVWTDMRDFVASGPFGTGFAQFIYFARK